MDDKITGSNLALDLIIYEIDNQLQALFFSLFHNCFNIVKKQQLAAVKNAGSKSFAHSGPRAERGGLLIDPDADSVSKNCVVCSKRFG